MIRHFQIKSDNPAYAAGKATFSFVEKIKGKRRCALIGLVPVAAEPSHAAQNLLKRFDVDGRQHKQGDDFPLSLIAGGSARAVVDNSGGTISGIIAALTNLGTLVDESAGVAGLTIGAIPDPADAPATADALREDLVANALPSLRVNAASFAAQFAIQKTFNTAMLGAIATLSAAMNRTSQGVQRGGYFPGKIIPLPDGTWAGGISCVGGSKVEVELEDATTNAAPITELILHGVEFPDSPADPSQWSETDKAVERIWSLLNAGVGEVVFYGNAVAQANGEALDGEVAVASPKMPSAKDFRRLDARYVVLDDTTFYVDEEEVEGVELQLYTNTQGPAQGGAILARAIAGDGSLYWPGAVAVDLECDQDSMIAITNGDPGADKTHYFATVFAGRMPGSEFLESSKAAA